MGFAQDDDYVDDILQVVRTDVNYEYAPDWNFHWAASYRQAEQNFDHFYFGNYCGLDGKTQRMRLVQKRLHRSNLLLATNQQQDHNQYIRY